MNLAKRGKAPCGHPGTHVTANFVACDLRCEFGDGPKSNGVPEFIDLEITDVFCAHCGSDDVKIWGPEMRVGGRDLWTCRGCGKSFHA